MWLDVDDCVAEAEAALVLLFRIPTDRCREALRTRPANRSILWQRVECVEEYLLELPEVQFPVRSAAERGARDERREARGSWSVRRSITMTSWRN